ncbi:zinc finger protein 574-like [Homarus americanus]|uniref:zinc finger protein 574-like n=1 Tax=Homarus americanus TaxID=6706 RepID=UPI001C438FFD|nr:zinc finger protein 574-like [Homarus americanus]
MTVGVMVGGHGREWAACVAPTTAHSESNTAPDHSCTQASVLAPPVLTPTSPLMVMADVHAEAATLTYAHEHQQREAGRTALRVTLTRVVKEGETPPLWFSSEVAAQLGLPFLNFSHIRNGVYVCPHCDRQFTAPNPLKLHLAARCDTLASHLLWERLYCSPARVTPKPWFTPLLSRLSDKTSVSQKPPLPPSRATNNSPGTSPSVSGGRRSPVGHKPVSPDSTSCHVNTSRPTSPRSSLVGQEPRSAFRRVSSNVGGRPEGPVPRLQIFPRPPTLLPPGPSRGYFRASTVHPLIMGGPQPTNGSNLLLNPRLLLGTLIPSHSRSQSASATQPLMPVMPLAGATRPLLDASPAGGTVDPCAEMETLVSNLGRSRRGHLCLYCGKVYSRKYGLKIHIRTHTGYKPLKCKVCLRPFGDPSNLNKHVRLHAEGETPYRCDHCGKVLVRRRDLDRHVRSRHPEALPSSANPLTDTDDEDDILEVENDDFSVQADVLDEA